jgi:IS5 family transposase
LSEEALERNKVRSSVRARVEHVFGAITTWMRGKLTRRIGLVRTRAWWGLRNLTYNFLRYLHCNSKAALAA